MTCPRTDIWHKRYNFDITLVCRLSLFVKHKTSFEQGISSHPQSYFASTYFWQYNTSFFRPRGLCFVCSKTCPPVLIRQGKATSTYHVSQISDAANDATTYRDLIKRNEFSFRCWPAMRGTEHKADCCAHIRDECKHCTSWAASSLLTIAGYMAEEKQLFPSSTGVEENEPT